MDQRQEGSVAFLDGIRRLTRILNNVFIKQLRSDNLISPLICLLGFNLPHRQKHFGWSTDMETTEKSFQEELSPYEIVQVETNVMRITGSQIPSEAQVFASPAQRGLGGIRFHPCLGQGCNNTKSNQYHGQGYARDKKSRIYKRWRKVFKHEQPPNEICA